MAIPIVEVSTNTGHVVVTKEPRGNPILVLRNHEEVNAFCNELKEKALTAYGTDYSGPEWDD